MKLERSNGYFQTWDPVTGRKIEGETRQCVHCSFMWIYNPKNSFDKKIAGIQPSTRGICKKCFGLVCARPECMKNGCVSMLRQIEELENKNRILLA
jgi:Pyruvate/2-oxoacid:ferredoxin oxidoreductase delta subunit